uniref:NADH-ubiquinone oxidoreductase chain 2 n=1 Tax=Dactylella sp. TaxID=1814903 RepID=A0A482DTE1_9PEZI|nr:NADH dehydrogenase subunit 2 [Dactylella sp.]
MLILSSCIILLINAVTIRHDKTMSHNRITTIILLYSTFLAFDSLHIPCIEKGIGIFGGLFLVTSVTQNFVVFIFIISFLILQLIAFFPRRLEGLGAHFIPVKENNLKILRNAIISPGAIIDFPIIIIFIIVGAVCLMSSCDLITMFLCLELQSYGLYILAAIYRNSELATSAGLTYFMIHNFDISLLILSVGYLFKVSSAPFHFWSPDVYDSLPTIVTTFVAIMAKISLFIFLFELVNNISGAKTLFTWTDILLISSLFSLIVGTIVGLVQKRIKRLFAYSTISHVGFILLALIVNTVESIQAYFFYIIQYSLSNLNFFIIIISVGHFLIYFNGQYYWRLNDRWNSPLQLILQLKGFFYKNYMLSLSLAITLLSFAGIPPLLGFFGKQMVLSAALAKGYYFMTLIAIITSVIGAVYYLFILKIVFFDNNEDTVHPLFQRYFNEWKYYSLSKKEKDRILKEKNRLLSTSLALMISTLTLGILLFVLWPSILICNAGTLAYISFNP